MENRWVGFYTIGGIGDPDFSHEFNNIGECQAWALNILQTEKKATPEDSFICTDKCMKRHGGTYRCDGNMVMFEGRFIKQ